MRMHLFSETYTKTYIMYQRRKKCKSNVHSPFNSIFGCVFERVELVGEEVCSDAFLKIELKGGAGVFACVE